jgi:hypothetical protein
MVHLKVAPPLSPIRSSTAPPLAGGIASIPSIRKEHPHERVHFSHDLARQREQWELLWRTSGILRTTLADAGQDGWGAAVTASSTAFAGLFLLLLTVGVSLAYSIAGSESHALTAGLNDFAWAGVVLTSFPRAMLIIRGGRRSPPARLAGRHHLAERRILGTGRCLFTFRLAPDRPRVDRGRQPGPFETKSSYACWMVISVRSSNGGGFVLLP